MNYKIDINKYINDDVNLVDIYLIKDKNENSINVSSSDKLEHLIDNIYKKIR